MGGERIDCVGSVLILIPTVVLLGSGLVPIVAPQR